MSDTLPGSPIAPEASSHPEPSITKAEATAKTADFKRFLELESASGKADPKEIEAFEAKLAPPEKAKAKKKADEPDPDETPTDETTDGEESGAEPEESTNTVDAAELAKSTQALKRYGMTASMLNKLSPEEIIEAGAKLAQIQQDNDKAQSELKTLKLKATPEKPADADKTPASVTADLSKWTKKLADLGYEDLAPQLAEMATEIAAHSTKALAARVEAIEAAHVRSVIDSAVQDVAREFDASILEPANRDRWMKKATQIAGAYEDERSCLRDAAKLCDFGPRSVAKDEGSKAQANPGRRNGVPPTNGRASPATQLSKADLEKKAMVAFEEGDRDEGRRLMQLAGRV